MPPRSTAGRPHDESRRSDAVDKTRVVEIRQVELDDPVVAPLLAALGNEYQRRYDTTAELAMTAPHEFTPPAGRFLVALDGDLTVAGGGFRYHDDRTCEIKRMWVHPSHRRQGLAVRILTELESLATSAGYRRVVLETGPRQPEAEALDAACGYTRTVAYGPWPNAIAYAKEL
jgi:GNAT superfamily N-acetyltransferase